MLAPSLQAEAAVQNVRLAVAEGQAAPSAERASAVAEAVRQAAPSSAEVVSALQLAVAAVPQAAPSAAEVVAALQLAVAAQTARPQEAEVVDVL